MRKKKDLPLVILKSLHPFVNLRGEKFEMVESKENLLKVIDQDSESEFHFIIEEFKKTNNGGFQFLMSRSPSNENENGINRTWVNISQLEPQFEIWLKLLDGYETVDSFFDDPIINSFKDEFYTEFEIIEEAAEINLLNTKQILLLDVYLGNVNDKLNGYITDDNSENIEEIQEDIKTLQVNLTKKSKRWIVNKLTTIWAKIAKQGVEYIKEFLTESKKEFVKQGIKGLIEFVKENGQELLN